MSSSIGTNRKEVSDVKISQAMNELYIQLNKRLEQKGKGSFASSHEILGILTEEFKELIDEIHLGNIQNTQTELMDIAVACVFGYACIENGTVDC
jgi:NTP pyrophosphatase (non-canonical NTP hydrolase)